MNGYLNGYMNGYMNGYTNGYRISKNSLYHKREIICECLLSKILDNICNTTHFVLLFLGVDANFFFS